MLKRGRKLFSLPVKQYKAPNSSRELLFTVISVLCLRLSLRSFSSFGNNYSKDFSLTAGITGSVNLNTYPPQFQNHFINIKITNLIICALIVNGRFSQFRARTPNESRLRRIARVDGIKRRYSRT